MSRYMNDAVLRRLRQESIDADSDKPSRVETLARDISNRQRQQSDGIKRRETNTNLAGTRAGESRTGALAAYLAEDGQRAARGRGSLPGTSQAPASSYLTGGGQSASQTSYGARAGGSRTEALAADLVKKDSSPTVPERLGAAAKSIGYSLAGSVPMLGSLAKQYDTNFRADLVNPERQALLNENETLNNRLNAIRQGYGNAAWGTEADIRAQMDANRARLQGDLRTSDTVKNGLGLELMRKSGEQQERALEGTTGIPRFLGGNAISIANNAPAMLTGPFAPLVMAIQAAAQKGYELNEQGVSPEEALVRGAVSGGIEALTEKYSVENFWKIAEGTGAKTAIKNLWRQAGVEASEESASYALNYLADKAARDPEATFSLSELAESAAGGALSGGFYGGVGLAVNRLGQSRTEAQSDAVRQDAAQALPTSPQVQGDTVNAAARATRENGAQAQQQGVSVPALQTTPTSYADSLGENGRQNLAWLQERTGRNDDNFHLDHWTYYKMGRQGSSPAVLDQMGVTGTLNHDEAFSAFSAGRNDGVAEAADTVQKLFEGETVGDTALDRALAFPDGRKAIERITGELPRVPSEARQAVRDWVAENVPNAAQKQQGAADAQQKTSNPQPVSDLESGADFKSENRDLEDVPLISETQVSNPQQAAGPGVESHTEAGLRRNEYSGKLDAVTAERLDSIAKRAGVSVEISDRVGATGSYQDGKILIRADAENPVRQVFVHELTHHLETSGEYQALSDLVVKHLQDSGTDVELALAGITQEYRKNGTLLTEDGARRELVAQFAEENLFTSERSIRQLAQEKRSVAQRIQDWLHDLVARFSGSKGDREAARFLQDAEKLYQKALDSAEGRQDGRVQYLIFTADESSSPEDAPKIKAINNELLEKVVANADIIERNGIVCELSGHEFETLLEGQRLSDAVADYYKSIGGVIERPGFGKVLIAKRGAKSSISHGFGETKRAAFAAVPEVIRSGIQIDPQQNWKGRKEDSYVFAGRVTVNGKPHDMAVVVMKNSQSSRFYLHEIIAIEKDGSASFMTGSRQSGGLIGDAKTSSSENSISQPGTDIKQNLDNGGQKSHGQSLGEMNERLAQLNDEEKKALKAENQRLQKRVESLQNQLKRTPPERRSAEQIRKIAREVLSDYESKADAADVREQLTALYEKMHKGTSTDELYVEASQIAAGIVQESQHLDDEAYKQYQGLRKQLRETRLTLSETDRPSIAEGYNEFRKRNRGRLLLTNDGMPVDALYSELCQSYPEFFSDEITHPADQLERISDVLDSLRPIYENPYSNNLGEAANTLALDLLERGTSVPAAKPTTADRFAETLQKERHGNRMLMQDNERQNQRIEALKQDQEHVQAELEAEKQRRVDELTAMKEHYKQRDEQRRQRKGDRLQREKLFKVAKRIDKMKTIPQNRAKIEELVGTIDLLGISIRKDTELHLSELRRALEAQQEKNPDWEIGTRAQKLLTRLDNTQIADMDIADVAELTDVLLKLETQIRNENKMLRTQDRRDAYAQAQETVISIRNAKAPKNNSSIKNKYLSMMLSPERFVRRLVGYDENSPLYRLTKDLTDGQRNAQRFEMESGRFFDKWHSNEKFMGMLTGPKAKRIEISGVMFGADGMETVKTEITPAQLVSLYLHSRHEANRAHIETGGVTIPDADLYAKGKLKEAYDKAVRIRLDENALRTINKNMTPELIGYANAVSSYLNGMAKDAINKTSVILDGYEKAKVTNYFPIRTNPDFTRVESESLKFDATIEGWGNLKSRENGRNPMLLEDVTDVLNRHITSAARYSGLAIPVRNWNKLMNVTATESAWSVKEAIRRKWGSGALTYLDNMLADVQGARKSSQDGLGKLAAKFRSAQAGAVLTVNPSVVMKQAASYPAAAGVTGWKPLIKALNPQAFTVDKDVIAKYTPDYWFRRKGYGTSELGDIVSRKSKAPAPVRWLGNLIQGVDLATTRTLWLASEYAVRERNRGKQDAPAIRSDAYYQQVAELYNEVIERTQPNYAAMQRPDILRSKDTLTQSLVMFKTQSFQNFNLLYDAYGNLRAKARAYCNSRTDENRGALKNARRDFARHVSAQVVSSAVLSAMTLAAALALGRKKNYEDEETGETTRQSVAVQLGKDFASSFAGMLLGGSEVFQAVDALAMGGTWYDIEAGGISVVNDMANRMDGVIKASKDFYEAYSDEDAEPTPAQAQHIAMQGLKLAKTTAEAFSVPASNVEKIFHAVGDRVVRKALGKYVGQYYVLLSSVDAETNRAQYLDLLYEAHREDSPEYETLHELVNGLGIDDDTIEAGFASRDKQTPEYTDAFDAVSEPLKAELRGNEALKPWAEKGCEQIKKYAQQTAKETIDEDFEPDKWVEAARNAENECGLSESAFLTAYAATRGIDSLRDKDGEAIDNSKSLLMMQAINQIPGLNDKQKRYLYEACGVGKSVRHYDRAKVEQELDKMEDLAAKGGARTTK